MPTVTTTTTMTSAAGVTTTTTTTTTPADDANGGAAGAEEGVPPGGDVCLMNKFHVEGRFDPIQTFPRMSGDFDAAWLSAALGAPVESFELR